VVNRLFCGSLKVEIELWQSMIIKSCTKFIAVITALGQDTFLIFKDLIREDQACAEFTAEAITPFRIERIGNNGSASGLFA